jgi:hypothetical protein
MRTSVTQKHGFGCGAACAAFVLGKSYEEVVAELGEARAASCGFYCPELIDVLRENSSLAVWRRLNPTRKRKIYHDNVIVFIGYSKRYPFGHYLVRFNSGWMDPWINLPFNKDIKQARSGFRGRLPGKPTYAIFPKTIF